MIHRSLITIAAIVLMAFCVSSFASAKSIPERCTVEAFRPFAAKVWDIARWERGAPKAAALQSAHERIQCAPSGHRGAMRRVWDRKRTRYYGYRAEKLLQRKLDRATPYGRWAIPGYIVRCESHGNFRAYNYSYEPHGPGSGPGGAYQIIWSTWNEYAPRGFVDYAVDASKLEQHIVAGKLLAAVGTSAWECA